MWSLHAQQVVVLICLFDKNPSQKNTKNSEVRVEKVPLLTLRYLWLMKKQAKVFIGEGVPEGPCRK